MAHTPAAEIEISPDLVRHLLRAQHPELADQTLALVTNGWDNVIYRLGEDLVVRLPRRLIAAELIENEQRWLPEIAQRVDVAVPRPLRVGIPSASFPWHWTISTWFDGTVASNTPVAERGSLAEPLAAFLTQLHTEAPVDAPANDFRGVPLQRRHPDIEARLESGAVPHSDALAAIWNEARTAPPWDAQPVWLHGDLHPANLLVSEHRELAAVLDFGDLTAGDPATDLAAAWLVFDPAGRETFRSAVDQARNLPDSTWWRARGWAVVVGTALVVSSDDSLTHRRMGDEILNQLLLD